MYLDITSCDNVCSKAGIDYSVVDLHFLGWMLEG